MIYPRQLKTPEFLCSLITLLFEMRQEASLTSERSFIQTLSKYVSGKANKLSLNFLKTEFMVIGNTRKYGELKGLLALRVGDSLIKRVKQTKSLGIIINQNLSWDFHIKYISKKIKKHFGILRRLGNTVPQHSLITLCKHLLSHIFNTVLLYEASVMTL